MSPSAPNVKEEAWLKSWSNLAPECILKVKLNVMAAKERDKL